MGIEQQLDEVRQQVERLVSERSGLRGLPPGLLMPDYEGYCISNLAGTILELFGLPAARRLPPGPWRGTPRRVALIVLDAMGLDLFLRAVPRVPELSRIVERGNLTALTSVFPSTTNVALTTLYTGLPPAEHGIVGLLLHLRELGATANLLQFRLVGDRGTETLRERGVEPRRFFPLTTLFERLAAGGVRSASVTKQAIVGTSLAEIHHAGAEVHACLGPADLCVTLGRLLAADEGPPFVAAYWDLIDTLSHRYGPGSDEVMAEVAGFFVALDREVLERRSSNADGDTLLLITADHGHMALPGNSGIPLEAHPEIIDCLLWPPAGSARYPYLGVLPGRAVVLRDAFERLEEPFHLWDIETALEAGLYGPGTAHPELRHRVGDIIALPRDTACLWRADVAPEVRRIRGIHGGLSEAEMLVPLLACRL